MARRDNSDPDGHRPDPELGLGLAGQPPHPLQPRLGDASGKPWDPARKLIGWNGKAWAGYDVPDYRADEDPATGMGPFIMNPEGVARLFARGMMADGPFPEHYEPFETPVAANPLNPSQPLALSNPAARVFKGDREAFGEAEEFPYVATTYRLTEHFHFWTKHAPINAILQPEFFVEIGEELAKEKGIKAGDRVQVSSKRGSRPRRSSPSASSRWTCDGKTVHIVGIPIHWGFIGVAQAGLLAELAHARSWATPTSQTPEFKAFLVEQSEKI